MLNISVRNWSLRFSLNRKVLEEWRNPDGGTRTGAWVNPTQVCEGAGIKPRSSRIGERTCRFRRSRSRVVAEPAGFSKAIVVTTDLQAPPVSSAPQPYAL